MNQIRDNIKPILALLIIIAGFSYFFFTAISGVEPNDQVLIAIVGLMSGATAYYFGSSTGGAKKDETIQQLADKNSNN